MSIFNSLGSNYNFSTVLKALFTSNNKNSTLELKKILSEKFGGEVILTYKGRQAIEVALKILNFPETAAVAINGFTCFAVYEAINNAGLNVVYLDIEKEDLNFSLQALKETFKKNPNIKAVIIQNTLGSPADIPAIADFCKEKGLILIEDLAHSVGTVYENGAKAGRVGDFVALSFSQDKMIDTVSGGALIVRNIKYQDKLKEYKELVQKDEIKDRFYPLFTYIIRDTYPVGLGKLIHLVLKKFDLLSKPMNNSMISTLAPWYCFLAKEGLMELEDNLNHRKKIAAIYSEKISKRILSEKVIKNIEKSTNLRFPIFVSNRDNLINFLKNKNIFVSDIWYDAPIAPKKFLPKTNYNKDCPASEKISETILNLPTHKNVTEKDATRISALVNLWLKQQ